MKSAVISDCRLWSYDVCTVFLALYLTLYLFFFQVIDVKCWWSSGLCHFNLLSCIFVFCQLWRLKTGKLIIKTGWWISAGVHLSQNEIQSRSFRKLVYVLSLICSVKYMALTDGPKTVFTLKHIETYRENQQRHDLHQSITSLQENLLLGTFD